MFFLSHISTAAFLLLLGGCTSYGVIDNTPTATAQRNGYSWNHWAQGDHNDDLTVMLSFSGGGTRAAALSYGALQALRDTTIEVDGRSVRLLAKDRRRYMHLIDGGITDNLGLHALYDIITLELMKQSLRKWADELKTPEHTVETHFIRIGLRGVKNPEHRLFFNKIPTSFALSQKQVDRLVSGGRNLLLDDPEYQRAVAALGGSIQGRN